MRIAVVRPQVTLRGRVCGARGRRRCRHSSRHANLPAAARSCRAVPISPHTSSTRARRFVGGLNARAGVGISGVVRACVEVWGATGGAAWRCVRGSEWAIAPVHLRLFVCTGPDACAQRSMWCLVDNHTDAVLDVRLLFLSGVQAPTGGAPQARIVARRWPGAWALPAALRLDESDGFVTLRVRRCV